MGKRLKVFLPSWMRWFTTPLLLAMWILITYQFFGTPSGRDDLGIVGWLGITILLILVGGVIWLMASGKLPAYIIKQEDDGER